MCHCVKVLHRLIVNPLFLKNTNLIMEVPTVAPRTPNVKGKEVSADLAKKKAAFERVFKAYKDRTAVEEVKTTSVILDFAPLQRLPSKPNFRGRILGFNFDGHCLIRVENKEFQSFQGDLDDFYAAEEIKAQNRIDPSELHIGWVVCSERFGSFYRAEVKYIDPLLKFCSVLDIDAGEYHAVDFDNLYHLEERFFHTSAQVIQCILDGLENVEKSIYLSIANKLKLPDNKIRVTSVQKTRKGEIPVVSVVTSKGDSLIDLLDEFLELDDETETMDTASESSSESVIEEARMTLKMQPFNHTDEPNIPAGYTRVESSILLKLVPSELEIAVKKLNGENTPQKGVLPIVTTIGAGEAKTVQKPIRPLVIPTMDDSGTDADCSDFGSTPEKQSIVAPQQNGIIKEDVCASFFVTSYGKQVKVILQEETTDYLFYPNSNDGHVPLPMTSKLDLSQFIKPANTDRTAKALQVVNKNPTKAEISTKIANPVSKGSLTSNFKAKLLGVDMYGFFFIQTEDPAVNSKYEEQQRRLNEFYTGMSKSQYRLTGEEIMKEGNVVGFILDGNFVRARIFESSPIECTLVDLEGHDFHFVNPVHMYRLNPQFLELPPQAVAVYLNGLESHLYTDAIPQAFQVTQLYPPTVTVEVSNDIDEAYLATSVKMTWGSKNEDVAELLLKSGREFLSPLEEEHWEDRIEAMILVRELLLKKKYLSRI